jgi:hypothetical protein
MRYLTLAEIVDLHLLIAKATGGATGIRDLAMAGVCDRSTESHL